MANLAGTSPRKPFWIVLPTLWKSSKGSQWLSCLSSPIIAESTIQHNPLQNPGTKRLGTWGMELSVDNGNPTEESTQAASGSCTVCLWFLYVTGLAVHPPTHASAHRWCHSYDYCGICNPGGRRNVDGWIPSSLWVPKPEASLQSRTDPPADSRASNARG